MSTESKDISITTEEPKEEKKPKEQTFDWKSIKACADKELKGKEVKKVADDQQKQSILGHSGMRAAFLRAKVLRANAVLKIAFLEQPPADIVRTPTDDLQSAVDNNGVALPVDPLQTECDNMDVISAVIHCVTKRLQPIVNIKFSFYKNEETKEMWSPEEAVVRISFNTSGGAWSILGRDHYDPKYTKNKKEPTMNLGWFDAPTTLHEFCHALGMVHEHQNPFGKPINWNMARVEEWALNSQGWDKNTCRTNITDKYSKDQINGSEFDPTSIMLYFFPGTLVNKDDGTCCGEGTQQNYQFSSLDVCYLNRTYPLKGQSLTPVDFTVKFFNDVYQITVDPKKLEENVKGSDERDKEVAKVVESENYELFKEFFSDYEMREGYEEPFGEVDRIKENYAEKYEIIESILIPDPENYSLCGYYDRMRAIQKRQKRENKVSQCKKAKGSRNSLASFIMFILICIVIYALYKMFAKKSDTSGDANK